MLPRLFSSHPPSSHGLSRLEVRVCLHNLKCCLYYFLEILDYISLESLVLGNVGFFLFFSSWHLHARAHTEEWVGVLVRVFIHQPPWLLILNGSQVSHTRSPSLLSFKGGCILSEQMKFCFSQNTFFLIPRNKLDGPTSRPADLRSRSCKE